VLEDKEVHSKPFKGSFDRGRMEDLLKRRFYFVNPLVNFDVFKGQFDLGPMGCALETNILEAWEEFFILREQMLRVESSILIPYFVLE
jgi:glycyl-tRNA synthetase